MDLGTQISTFLTGLGFGGEHFQIGKTKVCVICTIVVSCSGHIYTCLSVCAFKQSMLQCITFVYTSIGVYEGETEAGSAGRARGQGAG